MANGRNHQPNKQGALTSLKGYIYVVSIQGTYHKLLQVACTSCLPSLSLPVLVRLLPRGDLDLYLYLYLYLYLFYYACIFNSLGICAHIMYSSFLIGMGSMPAYSIPGGYVQKCCTFSCDFYGICACIFNSQRICA